MSKVLAGARFFRLTKTAANSIHIAFYRSLNESSIESKHQLFKIEDLHKELAIEDVHHVLPQIAEKPLSERVTPAPSFAVGSPSHKQWLIDEGLMTGPTAAPVQIKRSKYHRKIGQAKCSCGERSFIWADVYDVLGAFTGHYEARVKPIVDHLLKKLLAGGERGHKDLRQDMVDVRDSAQRAIDTIDEWS